MTDYNENYLAEVNVVAIAAQLKEMKLAYQQITIKRKAYF